MTSRTLRGTSLAWPLSWESLQVGPGSPSPGVKADEIGSLAHTVQALEGLLLGRCKDKQHSLACCRNATSTEGSQRRVCLHPISGCRGAVLWTRGLWHAARLIHMAGHKPGPSLLCIVGQGSERWSEAVSGLAVSHRPLSMLTLGGGVR